MTLNLSHSYLVLLVGLLVASGCAGSFKGEVDGIAIGERLEMNLEDIAPIPGGSASFDELRMYLADWENEERDSEVAIAHIPVTVDNMDARLAVAVDRNGRVLRTRLWGIDDPTSGWENFWRQFEYRTLRNVPLQPADSVRNTAATYWTELSADTSKDAETLRSYYRHRLAMVDNNQVIRRSMARTAAGSTPDIEWMNTYRDTYQWMIEFAPSLTNIVGSDATDQYVRTAEEAQSLLGPIISHARANEADALRASIRRFRRQTCSRCHSIELPTEPSVTIQDALIEHFENAGMRRDLFLVGADTWAVPGYEEESQRLATVIRDVLVELYGSAL